MTEREPWLGHRDLCSLQWSPYCDCVLDNGCTCPPHMDGVGREKWPDCPVHNPEASES